LGALNVAAGAPDRAMGHGEFASSALLL